MPEADALEAELRNLRKRISPALREELVQRRAETWLLSFRDRPAG